MGQQGWHPVYSLHEHMSSYPPHGQGTSQHQYPRPGYGTHQGPIHVSPHHGFRVPQLQGFPPDINVGSHPFGSGFGASTNAKMPPPPPQHHTQMSQTAQPKTAPLPRTQTGNEADLNQSGPGPEAHKNVQEPPPRHSSFNVQPHQNDHGGDVGSPKLVSVDWCFGKNVASGDLDLSKPIEHLQDAMSEIMDENFDIDLQSHSYRLVFCIPPSEESKVFVFKKNKAKEVLTWIKNWMTENSVERPFKCTVTKLAEKMATKN